MGSEEHPRVQRWISVIAARAVTKGSVLGPCAGANSAIAFIACSCSDRRPAAARELQFDPSASGEYLQIIQAARNTEEQNLEVYMKNGHLFFKAIKDIPKNTELLAWYGKDLSRLLGLSLKDTNSKGLICSECKQSFLFEFPLLAHQRFFCSEKPTSFFNQFTIPKIHSGSCRPTTDFHNIARELENPRSNPFTGTKHSKRRHSLESDTDQSDPESASLDKNERFCSFTGVSSHSRSPSSKKTCSKDLHFQAGPQLYSNITVVPKKENTETKSAFTSKESQDAPDDKNRSAFTLPPRISKIQMIPAIFPYSSTSFHPRELHDFNTSTALYKHLPKHVSSSNLWPNTSQPHKAFWPNSLPSLGLPMQNWCAKCNISFHLTSDLVQHMRSHHKRSLQEQRSSKTRDERQKCPVCNESFKERHHLSRHMTAHTQT